MPEKRRNFFEQWNRENVEKNAWSHSAFMARLLVETIGNEAGELIFTVDDAPAIEEKSAAVVRRLAKVALKLNVMGSEHEDEAVKNSDSGPAGSSPSESQSTLATTT
jgi:hypothetical protein